MTGAQWQTVGVIAALFFGFVTTYYLVRSNSREAVRQREADQRQAITEAKAPLIAENAQLSSQVAALKLEAQRRDEMYSADITRREQVYREEIARREQRITELEDRLWKRGNS